MFGRFARLIRSTSLKPLLACTLAIAAHGFQKIRLEETKPDFMQNNSP